MFRNFLTCTFILFSCASYGARPRVPVPVLPPVQVQTARSSMQQLILHAGYVFEGTVLRIEPALENGTSDTSSIQITFRIVCGLRGVRNGQTFTMHEWSGLWNAGERYWPGEKVVLFLYPPSRLGMTSPVGGHLGRFGEDANGQLMLNAAQSAILSGNAGPSNSTVKGPLRLPPAKLFQIIRREIE